MPHVIPPLGLELRVGPVVPGKRPDPARPGHLKGLPGPGPAGQEHRQDEPQGEFADDQPRVRFTISYPFNFLVLLPLPWRGGGWGEGELGEILIIFSPPP